MNKIFTIAAFLILSITWSCKKDEYPGEVTFTLNGSTVQYKNRGEQYAYFAAESSDKVSIFADAGKKDGSRLVIDFLNYQGTGNYSGTKQLGVWYWENISEYYNLHRITKDSFFVTIDEVTDEYISGKFSGNLLSKKSRVYIRDGSFTVYRTDGLK